MTFSRRTIWFLIDPMLVTIIADHRLTCLKILSCWWIHLKKVVTERLPICDVKNDPQTQYCDVDNESVNVTSRNVQIPWWDSCPDFAIWEVLQKSKDSSLPLEGSPVPPNVSVILITTLNFWNKAFLGICWNSKALSSCLTSICYSWKLNCKEEPQCIEIIIFSLPAWDKKRKSTRIHKWWSLVLFSSDPDEGLSFLGQVT